VTDAVRRYNAARIAFLKVIKDLTAETKGEARRTTNTSEEHDYMKYLATSFGALGQAVACHGVLTFEAWRRDYCGGRMSGAKRPLEDC